MNALITLPLSKCEVALLLPRQKMTTKQKAEKQRTKKGETTPAKANGKRKTKNDDVPEKHPNGIDNKKKKNEKTKKKMKEDAIEKDDSLSYQIPMSRVSRIIKTQDPNIRITQEAVYVINKASEKFLQVFTTEAYANACLEHKNHVDYKHLSSVVCKRRRFDFLSDFVPEKVKAEDALVELQAVEN